MVLKDVGEYVVDEVICRVFSVFLDDEDPFSNFVSLVSPEWFQPQMRIFIRFLLTKNILRLL
jgi:hypothetical protein